MTITKGMMTSDRSNWATPKALFDELDKEFNFTLDVCAEAWNAKCANYFDLETNGLEQSWFGSCWMNPPYGREISKWMEKAYKEHLRGGGTGSGSCSSKNRY